MELDLAGQLCSKAEPNEKANAFLKLWGWAWLVIVAVTIMMTPFGARAQMAGTGAISGTVTDASGAVIPNATVTAIAVDTNVKTVRSSTGAGDYNITPLTPGVYTVIVTAPGFEKFVQENVTVDALTTVAVNIKLAVGATQPDDHRDLRAPRAGNHRRHDWRGDGQPDVLQPSASDGRQRQRRSAPRHRLCLPDAGRAEHLCRVQQQQPNLQPRAPSTAATPTAAPRRSTSTASICPRPTESATRVSSGRPSAWTPSTSSRCRPSGFSAQYAGQGVQNYSIKQGTNQIHGSIYEYIRNTELDAWKPNAKTPTLTGAPVPTGGVCSSAALSASTSLVCAWRHQVKGNHE